MDARPRTISSSTALSGVVCIICFERDRDTTLSCGHANVCVQCVARLSRAAGTHAPRCPTCRAVLELPPSLRRPGLRPVRFAPVPAVARARAPQSSRSSRRARSLLTPDALAAIDALQRATEASDLQRRHSALGLARTPSLDPPSTDGRRVLVLAQRGVAVDAVCDRLRAQAGALSRWPSAERQDASAPTYVWVAANGGAADTAVAARVRALAPAVLVLAFDVSRMRSFESILRWDAAVPSKLPRVWAALSADPSNRTAGRVALRMSDVRDAVHCLGAPRTTIEVRLGAKILGIDADVRRLAAAVAAHVAALRPPRAPRPPVDPAHRSSPWALFRQCI